MYYLENFPDYCNFVPTKKNYWGGAAPPLIYAPAATVDLTKNAIPAISDRFSLYEQRTPPH